MSGHSRLISRGYPADRYPFSSIHKARAWAVGSTVSTEPRCTMVAALVDGRQIDHPQVAVLERGRDLDSGVDAAALRDFLVRGDTRPRRRDPRRVQTPEQLVIERSDDGADVLGFEARGGRGQLRHPHRRDALDDGVIRGHVPLTLDRPEPRLDLDQPRRRRGHRGLQLGPPQPQHGAQFLGGDLFVQDVLDLLEGQAEVLERDDAVEAGQLGGRVVAVAGGRVDVGRRRVRAS
ncbi:hypothetical protein AS594_37430 [Streptomyces agglomeratus]|uniref:Uncharacterized protein n=1 Tax=Streptomyces agglomeratus TaxID=285458 RepID=A0A1E5NY89_9ACTN|nr:hypothetical protein AS594_37430 [Streptomyces agglomeratus]